MMKQTGKDAILALGDEMKAYEAMTCDAVADSSQICVVRLDGHCFSTFTKGFDRPYDLRIHRAMVRLFGFDNLCYELCTNCTSGVRTHEGVAPRSY